ncbi:cytochrome P450 [Rhodocollybia butyracea]|uniref:Cytochrome P450 n=1 Tax=Rhodocollybia butyracea TaxID=206335 RepID=A0A9P5PK44_9AGAR|nr:cytochrome P450 [Rhodocollybia butyracea]
MPPVPLAFDFIALSLVILVGYEKGHIAYIEMGRKYNSDLVYLNVAGLSTLIVNSATAANDLFIARAKLYSNRCCHRVDFAFTFQNGLLWRKPRALFVQQLSSANLEVYHKPRLQEGIHVFLHRLMETPKELTRHLYLFAPSSLRPMCISVDDPYDPLLGLFEEAIQTVQEAAIPGTHLVDILPILEYIPNWFPGAGFKRTAASAKKAMEKMRNEPMEFVKRNMASGMAKSSIATRVLEQMQEDGSWSEENEGEVKKALGIIYAVISTIILGLVRNHDILKKGQAAVDAFVGTDRLPDFNDKGKIPYVDALIWEGLPLPHCTAQEDVYRGYYIPANTVAILHDPAVYGEDRKETIWLAVASILACFDLAKTCDKDGIEIDPDINFFDGLVSYPRPYECVITSRSKAIAEAIKQNFEQLRHS